MNFKLYFKAIWVTAYMLLVALPIYSLLSYPFTSATQTDDRVEWKIEDHNIYNAWMKVHPEYKGVISYDEFMVLRRNKILPK